MTVILNPFQGPPMPPSSPGPATNPWNGDPSGGTGFGDLLRGLVYSCSGEPGFLEVANLDKPASPSPVAADIFNQNGLLGRAVETADAGGELPAINADPVRTTFATATPGLISDANAAPATQADSVVVQESKPAPLSGMPVGAAAPERQNFVEQTAGPVATDAGTGAVMLDSSGEPANVPAHASDGPTPLIKVATVPTSALSATRSEPMMPAIDQPLAESADAPSGTQDMAFRARLGSLAPRLLPQSAAAMNTQVSVQAVEHGLSVVARIDQLGREEQSRLRDRLAATLSRHGFVGRRITLNGERITTGTSPAGEI